MGGHATDGRTVRERVRFYFLDHRTPTGKAIDVLLLALILVFVAVFVLETYVRDGPAAAWLWRLEVGITAVFVVEYLLRIYAARDRVAELFNPYTVVDLFAILPTVVVVLFGPLAGPLNVGFLRAFRVIRVLRFYRFTRDEEFFFGTVSLATLRAVKLLLTVLTIFFVSAGLFYSAENRVNPSVNNFGDAFYFTVVTLTTVGFGDIVPETQAGRLVTVGAILSGIILIPWQVSRIVKEWTYQRKRGVTCQQCGLAYHDADASHCKACGAVIYQEFDSRT